MAQMQKATHDGILNIGSKQLTCSVLEDGTRIISQTAIFDAFGRPPRGSRAADKVINLPSFIAAQNLLPYINQEVQEVIKPIPYINKHGNQVRGYKAEILPVICGVYLDAEEDGALTKRQEKLAIVSHALVRTLSKVGIIALVDEATGYQEIRDKKALQAILEKYLRKELAAWAERFPRDFYKEMFRLRGWKWNPESVARPSVVGRYTNDLVYERLAPNILEELEKKNPKNESGNRVNRHHQWLTDEVGHPALAQHIHAVIGFMRASTKWDDFYRLMQRAFPKKNEQLPLLTED